MNVPRGSINEPYETDTDALLSAEAVVPDISIAEERGHALGNKTLGRFFSFIFIINQIYGPGVLAIPIVFQQGGWLVTTVVLGLFAIISSFSATLLTEALSMIPGNKKFDKHIEFSGMVKFFYGKSWYVVFQVFLNICMQSYNIASIIICALSLDQFLLYIFGKTWALEILPHPAWIVTDDWKILYAGTALTISAGYMLVAAICLPAGFLNLDDNVKVVQLGSFIVLVVLMIEFCGQFVYMGLDFNRVPLVGHSFTQVVSVFIFSWAYVMFVPSWVNEKRDDVSVNKVIWLAGLSSFLGYLFIGLLAALAYPPLATDNILTSMGMPGSPSLTIIASYIFSLGVIAPGIPVCCITTRYNLYVGHICGRKMSYFWGVIAPWIVGFCFAQGPVFSMLLNWSSLIFNGIVNFVVPLLLYYKAVRMQQLALHDSYTPPSTVNPWPKFLRKYGSPVLWTLVMVLVTGLLVSSQVLIDLYYLLILKQNLLTNS